MANIKQINVGGTTYDIRDAGATRTTVIPNDNGEIKTKYRIAKKDYTGGASTYWYYEICKLPKNDSSNYASAIISGRIGGWTSGDMSYISALIWNRGTPGLAVIDVGGTATAASTIWNICDLVLYTNSDGTATLYAKCANYFTFDLDLELFQSTASITYTGNKLTSVSGTLNKAASSTTSKMELINGELYVAGTKMSKSTHNHNYSGTTGASTGTAVTAVTGVGSNGTATALTGVKVSSSSSAAPGGHTHSYSKTTGITLTANDSTATDRIAYVSSISSTGASASGTAKAGSEGHTHTYAKASLSGSNTSHTTKYMKFSAGTTPISSLSPSNESATSGANSGSAVSVVTGVGSNGTASVISTIDPTTTTVITGISGGSGGLTSNDTTSGIQYVKSISGGSGSLKSYNASSGGTVQTSSGRIKYLHDVSHTAASLTGTTTFVTAQGTFSAGTTPVSSASPSHTDTDTGKNSGSAVSAVTGISGGSGSLTSDTTSTNGIAYISSASHTAASLGTPSTEEVSASEHSHSVSGTATITRGTAPSLGSATTKYLSASLSTTSSTATGTANASSSSTVQVVTANWGEGGDLYLTSANVASSSHTHPTSVSYTKATGVTLTANSSSATGRIQYVQSQGSWSAGTTPVDSISIAVSCGEATGGTIDAVTGYPNFSGGSASHTTKYLHHSHTGASASGTANVAPNSHTHSYKKTTSISLTRGTAPSLGSATTGTVGISGGSISKTHYYLEHIHTGAGATTKYLHHSHTGASASGTATVLSDLGDITTTTVLTGVKATGTADVAPNGHTHSYSKTTGISITRGTAPSMNFNTGTTTDTPYVASMTNSSIGISHTSTNTGTPSATTTFVTGVGGGTTSATTKYLSASPSHTATDTGANSGTNFSAATAVGSNGTATVLTGVKATGTASVAPSGHIHTYSGSTN